MADVSVDVETGVVKMNKMVCVQDCGLVINELTAKSQVLGAMIMGIAFALSEERIMDNTTGRYINAERAVPFDGERVSSFDGRCSHGDLVAVMGASVTVTRLRPLPAVRVATRALVRADLTARVASRPCRTLAT